MRRNALLLLLTVAIQAGCATTTRPIIARDIAPDQRGKSLRDVHVVLEDGSAYLLTKAEARGDTLQGTTFDGRSLVFPTSDIRYAYRMESDRSREVLMLSPLAYMGLRALPALVVIGYLMVGAAFH